MSTFCPRGSGLRQGLFSALFGLGLLALAVAPSRGAFPSMPADIELDKVAQEVGLWSHSVNDSCALAGVPAWLRSYAGPSSGRAGPALLPSQHQALQQVASRDHSAVRKALAALWLGSDLHEADLTVVEPLLSDQRPALPLPAVHLTQAVLPCYPVSWSPPITVAQAAGRALTATFGSEFPSEAEYQRWRTANPQPFASVDYFATRLRGLSRDQAAAVFHQLEHYPAVLARVLMVRLPPNLSDLSLSDLSPAQQALVVAELSPDRLLRLLRRQEAWPELASDEGLDAFAQRVFHHPEAFFKPAHAPQILDLWDKDRTRSVFVRAAIAQNPSERPRILRQTVAALGDHAPALRAELISEFASAYYTQGLSDLQGFFLTSHQPNVDPPAVLHGLGVAGPPAVKVAKMLVLDPRFLGKLHPPPGISPALAEALVDLAAALGKTLPCPERSAFAVPYPLPVKSKAPVLSAHTAPSEQAAQVARRVCAQRVVDWLRTVR